MKKLTIITSLLVFLLTSCDKKHENVSEHKTHTSEVKNPLNTLMDGNLRFVNNAPVHPDETAERKKEISEHQQPFAAIVSCSDSRVPPEIVFDQGLGDLFVIRTAGNLIGDIELGSLEYAIEHLGVKLVMVLGHENCGVIKAFLSEEEETGNIGKLVTLVKNEEEEVAALAKPGDKVNNCVIANIEHGVKKIKGTFHEFLSKPEHSDIKIVGAEYDLNSGKVEVVL